MLIFDQNHRLVISNHQDHHEEVKAIQLMFKQQEGRQVVDSVIHIGSDKKIVNVQPSHYNNWSYVSVFSFDALTDALSRMAHVTIMYCVCILLLMGIIIVLGTRKIYHPVRKVYELSKQNFLPTPSEAKDELLYIEKHMDTLMKAKAKLNTQLVEHSDYIKETAVLSVLMGSVLKKSSDWIRDHQKSHHWKWFTVISTQIDSPEVKSYSDRDQKLVLYAIGNIVSELIPQGNRIGTMILDYSQITILVGDQETEVGFKKQIKRQVSIIKNSINNYLKIEVSIGIGSIQNEITAIPKSYKESLEALKYRMRLGTNVILQLDEIINRPIREFHYPQQLEEQLLQAIKKTNSAEACEIVHRFVKEIMAREIGFGEYQFIMLRVISSISRIIHDHNQSFQEVAGKHVVIDQIFQLHSEQEIAKWLIDSIIQPVITFLERLKDTQAMNLTEAVIEIIHKEYESDLSLEYCAARVNFHPNYVSRVFKKETGISFSKYLANYRLNMSERWLIETDMNISEMAERFKYNSAAAFIRYFRKMKGITPGEFRKRHVQ